jgi:hypothetical protein
MDKKVMPTKIKEADEYDHRINIIDPRFEKDFTMAGHKSKGQNEDWRRL